MKHDTRAVGGFFEDLPVLAFVLAGVMSVACAAAWSGGVVREGEERESLESSASQLVLRVVADLQSAQAVPTVEAVRQADLTPALEPLPAGTEFLVALCLVHPHYEQLLLVSEFRKDPAAACGGSALVNVLCDDGLIGVLEVVALVWEQKG